MFESFEKQMNLCSTCPRLCQSACPVGMNDANETHTPWGLMQTLNLVRKNEIPFDDEAANLSYQCLTCRACTDACLHHNDVPGVLSEVRKKAVELDVAPPQVRGFLAKFHKYNNPFAKDLLPRLKELLPPSAFEYKSATYFPSCTTIAKAPEVVTDTFSLFEKLKIDFVGVYPEPIQCCGYPLIAAGMEDEFLDVAEINFHALREYKTIISGSPACTHTLRETYKKYDFSLGGRVVTINQFIEPYLKNVNYRVKKGIKTKMLYHDPCYSSRYLGEVELPREMISHLSGYEPLEFTKSKTHSQCSGQGGCYSIIEKEKSDEITQKRLKEVDEKGISMVVTQCPSCIHKFRKNSKGLIVKDLISYANDCIEEGS